MGMCQNIFFFAIFLKIVFMRSPAFEWANTVFDLLVLGAAALFGLLDDVKDTVWRGHFCGKLVWKHRVWDLASMPDKSF